MSVMRLSILHALVLGVALTASTAALAQNRAFSFAYDQPKSSGYGAGAEMFDKKLKELSKGTLSINQYPSAQLGTEAQTMQNNEPALKLYEKLGYTTVDQGMVFRKGE